MVASLPMPPVAERTRGVKEECSTSKYSLLVNPLLLKFMLPINCCKGLVFVGAGEGVNVTLSHQSRSSETYHPRLHWLTHPILLHPVYWLRLHRVGRVSQAVNQVQYILHCIPQWAESISNLIMSEWWKTTFSTGKCMLYIKTVTTFALGEWWKGVQPYRRATKHHEKKTYVMWSHALWGGELWAKWKLLFLLPNPLLFEVYQVVVHRYYLLPLFVVLADIGFIL